VNPLEQMVTVNDIRRLTPPEGRAPNFLFFRVRAAAYCWTTESARDEKGRMRYASWRARLTQTYIEPVLSTRRFHALRKDAKARALRMYQESKK